MEVRYRAGDWRVGSVSSLGRGNRTDSNGWIGECGWTEKGRSNGEGKGRRSKKKIQRDN